MEQHPEVIELNRIRLDEDLTHKELAALVGGITEAGLHRVLKFKNAPMERTLHKIRRFLAQRKADAAREASRKRPAKKAS